MVDADVDGAIFVHSVRSRGNDDDAFSSCACRMCARPWCGSENISARYWEDEVQVWSAGAVTALRFRDAVQVWAGIFSA